MKSRPEELRQPDAEAVDEGGFTLIELLVVIVIMGILAAVVVFALGSFTSTSAASACGTDVKSVETAVQSYYATNGSYPAAGDNSALVGTYLRTWPNNPKYYTVSLAASGEVDVALVTGDPGVGVTGAVSGNTGAALAAGTAENADSWTYGSGNLSGSTICAGA